MCNLGLGHFENDADRLISAAQYLAVMAVRDPYKD
jgi:hypothetical protein